MIYLLKMGITSFLDVLIYHLFLKWDDHDDHAMPKR